MKVLDLVKSSELEMNYEVVGHGRDIRYAGRKYSDGLEEMSSTTFLQIGSTLTGLISSVAVTLSGSHLLTMSVNTEFRNCLPERGDLLSRKVDELVQQLLSLEIYKDGEEVVFNFPNGKSMDKKCLEQQIKVRALSGYHTELDFQEIESRFAKS